MNKIIDLFPKQSNLDNSILENCNARGKQIEEMDIYKNKVLALLVEICELANETKCFKYWSEKHNECTNRILEEYVDCLHFILSIGNHKGFNNRVDIKFKQAERMLRLHIKIDRTRTELFLDLISELNNFYRYCTLTHYNYLIDYFLMLGLDLGFTEQQIVDAYMEKNQENYKRQETNY